MSVMNNSKRSTLTNGLLASLAIQCIEPDTGATGCWLFTGESHRNSGSAKTPVFADLVDLFTWCRSNGWTPIGHGSGQRYIYHDYASVTINSKH